MSVSDKCESCSYEYVRPEAQFMFAGVRRCEDCGDIRRPAEDRIQNSDPPEQEENLL